MPTSTELIKRFREVLSEKGLHASRQRDAILNEFFNTDEHLTIEGWLERVKKKNNKIGYVTVYRTLNLLEESGFAHKHNFSGKVSFEPITGHHHDHMICLGCGKIEEFENETIEALQDKICKKKKFELVKHKMELYGYCERCSKKRKT